MSIIYTAVNRVSENTKAACTEGGGRPGVYQSSAPRVFSAWCNLKRIRLRRGHSTFFLSVLKNFCGKDFFTIHEPEKEARVFKTFIFPLN
jgi:hypothetical protein